MADNLNCVTCYHKRGASFLKKEAISLEFTVKFSLSQSHI